MSFLTLFTSPKPFTDPHIRTIQRNALKSWRALAPEVDVILFGDDAGVAEAAAEFGFTHIPDVHCSEEGVPYMDDMFSRVRQLSDAPVLAVVNTDVILFPDFVSTARYALNTLGDFVLVGRRMDLEILEELAFEPGFEKHLRAKAAANGKLKGPTASDYFIFSRTVLTEIPNFTIGRAGWDSWMIYHSLHQPWPILDATSEIFIIHQDHDYRHLPGGQPHYSLPESKRNVALGGGEQNMFNQTDLRLALVDGQVVRKRLTWYIWLRRLERKLQSGSAPRGLRGRMLRFTRKYRKGLEDG